MSDSISERDAGQGTTRAGHYLWVVLCLTPGATLATALMRQGLPVLYPFIQNEFGLSRAQVGLITSFQSIGFAAVVILSGWLADTFGVKRMITIGLLGLAAFTLAFPLAYSYPIILALAVFIGIVISPIIPASTRAVMDWFPSRIRGLAMSLMQMGVAIGGALTAAVLPALALLIGWRMAAAVTGLLILAIAIVVILLYRDAPRGIQQANKFNLAILKTMLRNRVLVTTVIWGATFVGFQFIALSYFMLFVIEGLELSPIMAGGLLAIAQVTSIISRVTWGAASDFIFHGRRTIVLAITGFLTVFWMLGASLARVGIPSATIYLLAIVIGMSTLSFHGVFIALIGEKAEVGQVGVTTGVATMVVNIAGVIMPPLFGHLVDISNSYSLGWRVFAAAALVCTLALLAFGRELQHRAPHW